MVGRSNFREEMDFFGAMPSITGGHASAINRSTNFTNISNKVSSPWVINRIGGGSNNNSGSISVLVLVAVFMAAIFITKRLKL